MQGAGTVPTTNLYHHDMAFLVVHREWVLHQELDLPCAHDFCGGDGEGTGIRTLEVQLIAAVGALPGRDVQE